MISSQLKRLLVLVLCLSITACANWTFSNRTVHQGNLSVVNASNKLKIGMSKTEVARIMGTSLVRPMFQSDRWDYALTTQKPRQEVQINSLSLIFEQNRLTKITKA